METGPRADLMKKYQKEFLDQTGIKLGIEVIPEQQARQKVAIELNSGKPSFDVFNFAFHVQKRQFEKAGWLQDISPWLKDPQMMPAEYELGDVSKMGMGFATTSDGQINALPILCDYFMVYYNKELFAKKGVAFPKTMDEMMVAASQLHDPAGGVAGFVGRGVRNANVGLWTQLLSGWGQETSTSTKPRQLLGHHHFLLHIHAGARGLFAIPQRRIENPDHARHRVTSSVSKNTKALIPVLCSGTKA
jgi:multiple sugar transport system substrate-binding protein